MNEETKILVDAIEWATQRAAKKLFAQTGESFYYFTLITSGEAHSPYVSAWSKEQLNSIPSSQRDLVKWSYADSPYCEYGKEFFREVDELFAKRPPLLNVPENEQIREYNLRLNAMESAVARLNESGIFGIGEARNQIVVNVEVMPPDHTNTERAIRLNPQAALVDWLKEAAE